MIVVGALDGIYANLYPRASQLDSRLRCSIIPPVFP